MTPSFAVLGRFLVTRSSGPAALKIGLPLYLTTGICATVIFAPSGLNASTVVERAESTWPARLVLIIAWTVAALPVVRAIVCSEANAFLRSLPISRSYFVAWLGALMLFAELPWFVLWLRGGGVTSGLGAVLTVLAVHACVLARVRTWVDATLVAMTWTAWMVAGPFARIMVAGPTFVFAVSRAWQRMPERGASPPAGGIVGSASLALAVSYGLVMSRRHAAALLRAAFIIAVAMAWTGLLLRNDDVLRFESKSVLRVALSAWIPSCILAAATPVGPILRTETAAEWLLAACGITVTQRRAATIGLLAATGSAVGLLAGALLGIALGAPGFLRFALAASLGVTGALLSALTEVCVRWSIREDGRTGGRMVLILGALIALAEGVLWISAV
jgi:hypothetical protein